MVYVSRVVAAKFIPIHMPTGSRWTLADARARMGPALLACARGITNAVRPIT